MQMRMCFRKFSPDESSLPSSINGRPSLLLFEHPTTHEHHEKHGSKCPLDTKVDSNDASSRAVCRFDFGIDEQELQVEKVAPSKVFSPGDTCTDRSSGRTWLL